MPATTSKQKVTPTPEKGNGAPSFVRCDLSDTQKEALKSWVLQAEETDLLKWLSVRILANHVVSIRANEFGFQCSVTGAKGSNHENVSLVARASSPLNAMYAAWYKDELVLQGIWPVVDRLADLDL